MVTWHIDAHLGAHGAQDVDHGRRRLGLYRAVDDASTHPECMRNMPLCRRASGELCGAPGALIDTHTQELQDGRGCAAQPARDSPQALSDSWSKPNDATPTEKSFVGRIRDGVQRRSRHLSCMDGQRAAAELRRALLVPKVDEVIVAAPGVRVRRSISWSAALGALQADAKGASGGELMTSVRQSFFAARCHASVGDEPLQPAE